jgi:hypothetical protein
MSALALSRERQAEFRRFEQHGEFPQAPWRTCPLGQLWEKRTLAIVSASKTANSGLKMGLFAFGGQFLLDVRF